MDLFGWLRKKDDRLAPKPSESLIPREDSVAYCNTPEELSAIMARSANIVDDGNALRSVAHRTGTFFTLPNDSNAWEAAKKIAARSSAYTKGIFPLHKNVSETDKEYFYPLRDAEERLIGGVVEYFSRKPGKEKSVVVYAADKDILAKFEAVYKEIAKDLPTKPAAGRTF